jgi:predicted DNA-binding protein
MKTKPQKPAPSRPVSLRINADTSALIDYLIERTGLKEAQVIRLAIKRLVERERSEAGAAAKPASKKH